MAKFKTLNHFSKKTVEEFFPTHLLTDGILGKMGIWAGGISYLHADSMVLREANRFFHIMIIGLSGEGEFVMENGDTFILKPGEFFFSSSFGQGHRHFPLTEMWKLCWIQIFQSAEWLTDLPEDYIVSPSLYKDEISDCFKSIISEENGERDDYVYVQDLRSQLLIQYLKRELNLKGHVGKSMKYIRDFNLLWKEVSNDISRKWEIEDMCAFMNMSRAHLIRLCKEYYGVTPTKKVHQLKMNYANSLLRIMGHSVSEVADQIGYESLSSFTSAFKKFYGIVPSELT